MKVLIYLDKNLLSPAGGPLGVGYYLYQECLKVNDNEIEFLDSDLNCKIKDNKKKKILYKFRKITKIVRSIRHIKEYKCMFDSPSFEKNRFNDYDIVHFHTTSDMYKQRRNLKDYKGIVLITSHSPIPLAQELYEACATSFEKKWFKKRYNQFIAMDEWSFKHASYIIFPCKYAEEPYSNNWESYREIQKNMKNKYRYVPTGIERKDAKISKQEIRTKYKIKENDFLVSYVGRHNSVKGFDTLKTIGESVLSKNNDIKFIIAGREGPIYRLENKNWIEVGFTKDPYSIINASDVFILPNKETYFDLVMIEVLSLGKIVIASRTGGNKFFEEKKCPGVFLYDSVDEAEELLLKIKGMTEFEKKVLEVSNFEFYEKHLTSNEFYNNYKNLLHSLLD